MAHLTKICNSLKVDLHLDDLHIVDQVWISYSTFYEEVLSILKLLSWNSLGIICHFSSSKGFHWNFIFSLLVLSARRVPNVYNKLSCWNFMGKTLPLNPNIVLPSMWSTQMRVSSRKAGVSRPHWQTHPSPPIGSAVPWDTSIHLVMPHSAPGNMNNVKVNISCHWGAGKWNVQNFRSYLFYYITKQFMYACT